MEQEFVKVTLVGFGPIKKQAALNWCEQRFSDTEYDFGINGTEIYFRQEENAMLFLMAWS